LRQPMGNANEKRASGPVLPSLLGGYAARPRLACFLLHLEFTAKFSHDAVRRTGNKDSWVENVRSVGPLFSFLPRRNEGREKKKGDVRDTCLRVAKGIFRTCNKCYAVSTMLCESGWPGSVKLVIDNWQPFLPLRQKKRRGRERI
jgi:hypothetical protein